MLHMHQTDTRMALRKYKKNGGLETTLATEMYDFDFQDNVDTEAMTGFSTYTFRGGDQVLLDCYCDETNRAESFAGVFGSGSADENCEAFVYYWSAENYESRTSFECSPNDCDEYCGSNFLADESGFQRTLGTPCDESLATYDYTKYDGCNSGSSILPVPVGSPTISPIVTAPTIPPTDHAATVTSSPTPSPTPSIDVTPVFPSPVPSPTNKPSTSPTRPPSEGPDAMPSNSTNDDSGGRGGGGGGGGSSKKKSEGGLNPAISAVIAVAVLIMVAIALLAICCMTDTRDPNKGPADAKNLAYKECVVEAEEVKCDS